MGYDQSDFERVGGFVVAAAALVLCALHAGMTPLTAAAETEMTRYEVDASMTGPIIDDDDTAFSARHQIPSDPSGGIDRLLAEWGLGEGRSARVNGRGVFNARDYLLQLLLSDTKLGKIDAGYRQYRTWYDGTGGRFKPDQLSLDVFDDQMSVDRGRAWFDATFERPDLPVARLKYEYIYRDGQTPSLAWGQTNLTGGFGTRAIVNAFNKIDESRNVVDLDVRHSLANTKFGAGFRYENPEINNQRNMARNPDEVGVERYVTQRNNSDADVYSARAFTESRFLEEAVLLTTSYAYNDVDNDIGGSRIYGDQVRPAYDATFANRQPFDTGFLDLGGNTNVKQHVGNVGLRTTPMTDTVLTASIRVEDDDIGGHSNFTETAVGPDPARVTTETPLAARSSADKFQTTESVDLRYSGFSNLVLYAEGEWEQVDHNLRENEQDTLNAVETLARKTDMDRDGQKYKAGLTWYPLRQVSWDSKFRYERSDSDYKNKVDSTDNTGPNRYPAYITSQDLKTYAADSRVTLRLTDDIRVSGRYDFAQTKYDTQYDGLREIQSGKVTTHRLGADTNWNPIDSVFVQSAFSYVRSSTDTPASTLTGPAEGLAANFKNDYWNASLTTGWAPDEKSEIDARYFFYYADDYKNQYATFTQPYGADVEEHGASVGYTRRLTETVTWSARYGFFKSNDHEFGGRNDYTAHLLSTGVKLTF